MKTIKCIISILLGVGLGLLSACFNHRSTSKSSTETGTNVPSGPKTNSSPLPATNLPSPQKSNLPPALKTNAMPGNQENLPVRRPILE